MLRERLSFTSTPGRKLSIEVVRNQPIYRETFLASPTKSPMASPWSPSAFSDNGYLDSAASWRMECEACLSMFPSPGSGEISEDMSFIPAPGPAPRPGVQRRASESVMPLPAKVESQWHAENYPRGERFKRHAVILPVRHGGAGCKVPQQAARRARVGSVVGMPGMEGIPEFGMIKGNAFSEAEFATRPLINRGISSTDTTPMATPLDEDRATAFLSSTLPVTEPSLRSPGLAESLPSPGGIVFREGFF